MSASLKVECYAGYKADERPLRFCFIPPRSLQSEAEEDRPPAPVYEVIEVVDRWYGPGYECFRVRADDGNFYILRHQLGEDTCCLDAFRRRAGARRPSAGSRQVTEHSRLRT